MPEFGHKNTVKIDEGLSGVVWTTIMSALGYAELEASLPQEALTEIEGLPYRRVASGKVREIFDLGEHLLLIASDRISAFDCVMPNGIPGKGIILTQISRFWFHQSKDLTPNQLPKDYDRLLADALSGRPELIHRSLLVKKLNPLPVEAVVRGYISGSGWSDYKRTGSLFGQEVPAGLQESQKLPRPYFTPTSKAKEGHDEPMSLEECRELLGEENFRRALETSLALYAMGAEQGEKAGIIVADTKFEFGTDDAGGLYLIDEVLTPDSSRFWPASEYAPGGSQPSFDKQYVRDYLNGLDWDKTPPAPALPKEVVKGTQERYLTAARKLLA